MESRAKERLTGAIILVVVIVLLVPELLSGPRNRPKPAPAPADAAPLRRYTVDLREDSHGATASGPATSQAAATQTASAAQVAATPQPVASPAPTDTPRPSASEESKADQPAAAAPKSEPRAAEGRSAEKPAGESHAAVVAHAPAAGTAWSVQLGSFASEENAQRLAGELRARGFHTSVSEGTGAGRRWFRVRVGPERDRAAAQAVAVRLRALGHTGSIVPSS